MVVGVVIVVDIVVAVVGVALMAVVRVNISKPGRGQTQVRFYLRSSSRTFVHTLSVTLT